MSIRDYFDSLLGLIFPTGCPGCERVLAEGEYMICTYCRFGLPYTNFHQHSGHEAAQLFWGITPVEFVLSYLHFRSESKVQQIIHHMKYKNMPGLARYFGKEYGTLLIDHNHPITEADALIPVPMQKQKETKRGYNQSEMFALGLSDIWHIPVVSTVLKRKSSNQSQIGKGRLERFLNTGEAFDLVGLQETLTNARVVLVDDVLTTGATLSACAEALYKGGVSQVSVLTMARKR